MNLSVGDVVFVLDKKTQAVVPCQLVERISSVTLEGEEVKNIAVTPGKKRFVLEEYSSPWFENYTLAHEYLNAAALELVANTMKRAEESAFKAFNYTRPDPKEEPAQDEMSSTKIAVGDESITSISVPTEEQVYIDMGGQKVRVTLPKELSEIE